MTARQACCSWSRRQCVLVIASYTERLDLIQPKHVYVVVANYRLRVKCLRGPVKRNEPLELLSDNRFYAPFILPQEDLRELWQVRGIFTRSVPANANEAFDRSKEIGKLDQS